jgi:NADPH2:quinone reductase
MKSIRIHAFGGPEVLKIEELPDPTPSAGQVVVRVKAIGVNPVDTYIRAGKYGPRSFPFTPGTDAAGIVESVGSDVRNFKPGDRVYVYGALDGAYAQLILCSQSQVHPLAEKLTFEQGAAIGVPYGTAYRALFVRGHARPNEIVLIHGASGGVGTAAVQLAVNFGCRVFGTAGNADGVNRVRHEGVEQVFNHHEAGYLDRILSAAGGQGVNLILEMLANVNLEMDLGLLAKAGRVVVIGNRGRVEIDPRQTMAKDSDIRGMSLMHADDAELAMIHAALGAGFENGTLVPVVSRKFKLSEAGQAHEAVMEPGAHGKIVIEAGE